MSMMKGIRIEQIEQYEKYVDSYLEQTEYKNMVRDLNCIFNSMINLSDKFNFNKDIEKLFLAYTLINVGYFSSNTKYPYNTNVEEIGLSLNHDRIIPLSLVPIMGNGGCCRHTAALLSQSLNSFNIKNDIALVDIRKRDVEISRIKHFLSEFHQKELHGTHVINYVSIDNNDFFVEGGNDAALLNFYYGDEGLAFPFFLPDDLVTNYYLLCNYSFLYNEKKDYDKVKKVPFDKQLEILHNYKKTIKLIKNNIDIVIESYKSNIPYMADIKDNYQKVYTKEGKFREWLEK
mgnify:CR=1 FL=1